MIIPGEEQQMFLLFFGKNHTNFWLKMKQASHWKFNCVDLVLILLLKLFWYIIKNVMKAY